MTNAPATTNAPADLNGIFGRNLEPDSPAPMLEREQLRAGVVVQHKRSDSVPTQNGRSMKHIFSVAGAPAGTPWFSLWGSANLNSMLRKAKPGAVLFLRYDGQETNPDGSNGAHQWTVQPTTAPAAQIRAALEKPERKAAIREFATLLERTLTAERERRNAARGESPAGPPHDDDDLPF